MDAQTLGLAAEDFAAHYLKRKGYRIRKRNYRYLKAEIDIIAEIDNTLAVIEVKARTTHIYGTPESFVSPKQIGLILMAANHFIEQENLNMEVRFDILAILRQHGKWEANHIENAFYSFDGS